VGDECGVDALGERQRIRVVAGPDDGSGMSPLGFAMEPDEIEAVLLLGICSYETAFGTPFHLCLSPATAGRGAARILLYAGGP
jgi:hypothetical protein